MLPTQVGKPLIELKVELERLRSTHAEGHHKVVAMVKQIKLVEEELTKIAPFVENENPAERALRTLRSKAKSLKKTIEIKDDLLQERRKKIEEDFSSEPIIHTVRGVGYTVREN
jgi:DNA-binding response OmpR family regulator